jgi:hypothetical protein
MTLLRFTVAAVSMVLLGACTPEAQNAFSRTLSEHFSANPLGQSELRDVFKKNPVTNTNSPPEYPRISIEVTSVSPVLFAIGINDGVQVRRSDCIRFNATLWHSSKNSKRFEGMRLCAGDDFFGQGRRFQSWAKSPYNGKNTGQNRTNGPLPPAYPYPTDQVGWLSLAQLPAYFDGLLGILGFDYNFNTRGQVWIVSVPPGSRDLATGGLE